MRFIKQLFCNHDFRLKTLEYLVISDGKLIGSYQYSECCKCKNAKTLSAKENNMAIPVIDFKTMRVLAITRCTSDKLETKATYLNSFNREDSLYFKCSNEEHDQFASEFKNYLKCVG